MDILELIDTNREERIMKKCKNRETLFNSTSRNSKIAMNKKVQVYKTKTQARESQETFQVKELEVHDLEASCSTAANPSPVVISIRNDIDLTNVEWGLESTGKQAAVRNGSKEERLDLVQSEGKEW